MGWNNWTLMTSVKLRLQQGKIKRLPQQDMGKLVQLHPRTTIKAMIVLRVGGLRWSNWTLLTNVMVRPYQGGIECLPQEDMGQLIRMRPTTSIQMMVVLRVKGQHLLQVTVCHHQIKPNSSSTMVNHKRICL